MLTVKCDDRVATFEDENQIAVMNRLHARCAYLKGVIHRHVSKRRLKKISFVSNAGICFQEQYPQFVIDDPDSVQKVLKHLDHYVKEHTHEAKYKLWKMIEELLPDVPWGKYNFIISTRDATKIKIVASYKSKNE